MLPRLIAIWIGSAALASAGEPAAAIRWRSERAPVVTVEVAGLSAATVQAISREAMASGDWARFFGVFAGEEPQVPAMAGTWAVEGSTLRFEPRFPVTRGLRYRAEFRPDGGRGAPALTSTFELPAENSPPSTVVRQIYPSAATLPENELKFYVQFSAPMSGGAIYRHIHLRDAAGKELELPFLEIDEELWNPAMTRLTLLIDPGRIKRGVKPLVDIGPVFEEGKNYSLEIDAAWTDAKGQPLVRAFKKEFRIGAADRTPPDPARWRMTPPGRGGREPLRVEFDESMDHALAIRLIVVANARGEAVAGEAALGELERRWLFTPAEGWTAGQYQLVVPTTIEDLAGNNIGKVFDVDVFENIERKVATTSVKVSFAIK